MTHLKAFYYFVAIYGFGRVLRDGGGPDDIIDIYGQSFDSSNYARAIADEFERGRYKERIRAKIADEIRNIDFSEKFTFVAQASLGEYSFGDHSFPLLRDSFQEYRFCIGPEYPIGTCTFLDVYAFRAEDAVNGNDFDWSLPMSETDASAFVKSRSTARLGEVDRRIAVRITYSVVNKQRQANPYFPKSFPIFIPFIYSVEAYGDKTLTAKLGVIPKINSLGANTAEELRLATIAAKTPTKEIGKYRGYPYCRQPKSDGKIHDPLAPPPPCDQWVRSYTLTDIGVALVNEKSGAPSETERINFFDRPESTLFRENDSRYWNYKTNQAELKYGLTEDKSFSVVWKEGTRYQSLTFESREERDRFFADLSRAFQEWKTKYSPFQFSAGELNIDQRCLASQTFVPCPSSGGSASNNNTGATNNNTGATASVHLMFVGKEDFESQGRRFTGYRFSVSNRADFPDEMFQPAPNLPPCGRNANASRSWVVLYNRDGKKLNTFCGLTSSDGLRELWFALRREESPPEFVYIVITDRKLNNELKSNLVSTSGP